MAGPRLAAGGLAGAFQHRGQRSPGPGSGGAGTASTREESDAFVSFSSLSSSSGAGGVAIRLGSRKRGYGKGQFLLRRPSLRGGGGDNPAARGASLRVGARYVREVVRLRSGLL